MQQECFFELPAMLPQQARSVRKPLLSTSSRDLLVLFLAQKSSASLFIGKVLIQKNIWMKWLYKFHIITVPPTFLTPT